MRWFRRHQYSVGILALFALGFQLAFAFAHVHLDGIRPVVSVSVSPAASPDRLPAGLPDSPGAPTARPHHGTLAMRGLEVAAAALITVFGAMLLCGYLVDERMIGL
jgi:hypothetical protein